MPAIRYLHNHTGTIVTPTSSGHFGYVTVRLHGGSTTRIQFLGFVCEGGTRAMPLGAYSKMLAMEVTADDGQSGSVWTRLEANQFVLCWRVQHMSGGMDRWGVYAIIDSELCPIVMTDKNLPPPKPSGTVHFLGQRKSPPKAKENKLA